MVFRCLYCTFLRWLYCPRCWQYLQVKVIKFKSGFILLWLSEARNSGRSTRAGCWEDYRVPAIFHLHSVHVCVADATKEAQNVGVFFFFKWKEDPAEFALGSERGCIKGTCRGADDSCQILMPFCIIVLFTCSDTASQHKQYEL